MPNRTFVWTLVTVTVLLGGRAAAQHGRHDDVGRRRHDPYERNHDEHVCGRNSLDVRGSRGCDCARRYRPAQCQPRMILGVTIGGAPSNYPVER